MSTGPAQFIVGGPVCTRYENGVTLTLPGCNAGTQPFAPQNNPAVTPRTNGAPGAATPAFLPGHPLTGQFWNSELAALSWNLLVTFVTLSTPDDATATAMADVDPGFPGRPLRRVRSPRSLPHHSCSYANPILCKNVAILLGATGAAKNTREGRGQRALRPPGLPVAGGAAVVLEYQKRNILGFSTDFAEDHTRRTGGSSSPGSRASLSDNDSFDTIQRVDPLNLVISVDRPTFIRFLNRCRTFFINPQLFFQYLVGYRRASLAVNGPFNTLATFTVATGYYQDRMIPSSRWCTTFRHSRVACCPR